MRVAKFLIALAFAFCAFASIINAQTAYNIVNVPAGTGCLWTSASTTVTPPPVGSDYFAARDPRPGVPAGQTDENGKIFVAWNQNGGGSCATPVINASFQVYVYMQLDSTVGDRCFFINDGGGTAGCTFVATLNGAVDAVVGQISTQNDVPGGIQLPAAVTGVFAGAPYNNRFFIAGTDHRPEDAAFNTHRALTACNVLIPRQFFNDVSYDVFGWGYQTANANIGTAIAGDAAYGGGSFHVYNFNIIGNDPITNAAVPSPYTVSTIGAQPELVIVGPNTDGDVANMTDIPGFTLSQYYAGNLGRTTDLFGVTVAEAMNFLVREPLSGTYSIFEYSNPQSTQFHTSQETGNCSGATFLQNPLHLATAPGTFAGAVNRIRSIGTGNIYKFVDAAPNGTPVMGYAFWSAGNVANLTQTRYLKVNGIDPLLPAGQYNGLVPGSKEAGAPPLANVNFAGLNAGDYSIWSALRLVSDARGAAGVSAMLAALDNLTVLQNDYIKRNNMNIWHSHFQIVGQPANTANGPSVGTQVLCASGVAEAGGDAGGATMLIVNNRNFCHDFSSTSGKLNLTF